MVETQIILEGKQAKMWTMMQALDTMGAFDVRFGSITINFDGEGKISSVEKKQNYRMISTPTAP